MTLPEAPTLLDEGERSRLREIARLGLAGEGVGEELHRFVEAVTERLGAPVGLVSIVLDDVQFFLASKGLEGWIAEVGGTPREWSFCDFAVKSKVPFVVTDARNDDRVRDNPVVQAGAVAAYAGAPLLTRSGHALGTLCVLDGTPREFTEADVELLRTLAAELVGELERAAA